MIYYAYTNGGDVALQIHPSPVVLDGYTFTFQEMYHPAYVALSEIVPDWVQPNATIDRATGIWTNPAPEVPPVVPDPEPTPEPEPEPEPEDPAPEK